MKTYLRKLLQPWVLATIAIIAFMVSIFNNHEQEKVSANVTTQLPVTTQQHEPANSSPAVASAAVQQRPAAVIRDELAVFASIIQVVDVHLGSAGKAGLAGNTLLVNRSPKLALQSFVNAKTECAQAKNTLNSMIVPPEAEQVYTRSHEEVDACSILMSTYIDLIGRIENGHQVTQEDINQIEVEAHKMQDSGSAVEAESSRLAAYVSSLPQQQPAINRPTYTASSPEGEAIDGVKKTFESTLKNPSSVKFKNMVVQYVKDDPRQGIRGVCFEYNSENNSSVNAEFKKEYCQFSTADKDKNFCSRQMFEKTASEKGLPDGAINDVTDLLMIMVCPGMGWIASHGQEKVSADAATQLPVTTQQHEPANSPTAGQDQSKKGYQVGMLDTSPKSLPLYARSDNDSNYKYWSCEETVNPMLIDAAYDDINSFLLVNKLTLKPQKKLCHMFIAQINMFRRLNTVYGLAFYEDQAAIERCVNNFSDGLNHCFPSMEMILRPDGKGGINREYQIWENYSKAGMHTFCSSGDGKNYSPTYCGKIQN